MLAEMGSTDEAADWVWGCIAVLESAEKADRGVSAVLLDALGDNTKACLANHSTSSSVGGGLALAARCLRDLCDTTAEDGWRTATSVRFVLAIVGETTAAAVDTSSRKRLAAEQSQDQPAETDSTGTAAAAADNTTRNEMAAVAEERWKEVLSAAGGPESVACIAEALLTIGEATELEAAGRLATKAGIAAALSLPAVTKVVLALLKRGSFTQLTMLIASLSESDSAAADTLKQTLLSTAPPKSTQRLAAALGMEPPPMPHSVRPFRPNSGDGSGAGTSSANDSMPWLAVDESCMNVKVVVTAEECEAAVAELSCSLVGDIGLDTEWADNSGGRPTCVLLQIASASHCVLVRLESVGASGVLGCRALTALLADSSVAKAGVGIARDAALLKSEWGLTCASTVELSALAQAVGMVEGKHGVGLASLSRLTLTRDLRKSKHLRCGDWRAEPLSEQQIEYGALDAIAGQRILAALYDHGRHTCISEHSTVSAHAHSCVAFCAALAPGQILDCNRGAMPDKTVKITTTQVQDASELREWAERAAVGESRSLELSQSRRLHLHRTCIALCETQGYLLQHESTGEPQGASQRRSLVVRKIADNSAPPAN